MSTVLLQKFRKSFDQKSNQEVLYDYNRHVGSNGWCSAKGTFLYALKNEMLSREWDIAIILNASEGLLLNKKVFLENCRLVYANE